MRHLYEDEQLRDEPARTGCSLPVSPGVGGDGPGVGGRVSGVTARRARGEGRDFVYEVILVQLQECSNLEFFSYYNKLYIIIMIRCFQVTQYDCLEHTRTTSLPDSFELIARWRALLEEFSQRTGRER